MPKTQRQAQDSNLAGPSTTSLVYKPKSLAQRDPDGLPGVSKIKASIRQTRRFLAKDSVEPGIRLQTERRLASLLADLEKAERRGVEKKFGSRYHKVKFFERQKLLRLIPRLLKATEAGGPSKGRPNDRILAENQLEHARVMLNYVLYFPNSEKYIALFPTLGNTASGAPHQLHEDTSLHLPNHLSEPVPDSRTLDRGSRRRLEVLLSMRRLMAEGKVSSSPEIGLKEGKEGDKMKQRPDARGIEALINVESVDGAGRLGDEMSEGNIPAKRILQGEELGKAKKGCEVDGSVKKKGRAASSDSKHLDLLIALHPSLEKDQTASREGKRERKRAETENILKLSHSSRALVAETPTVDDGDDFFE